MKTKFTMDYKTKTDIDYAVSAAINTKIDGFDPTRDIEDYEALDKYVLNHNVKRPSYGREIWQAISAAASSIREALEYWNLCWFQHGEAYRFCFPPFNWEYEPVPVEIPAPTEENFLSYIWEA